MTTERIDIDSPIKMGKPVIRGTRITVERILGKLAEGAGEDQLLEDYPHYGIRHPCDSGLRRLQRGPRGRGSVPNWAAPKRTL